MFLFYQQDKISSPCPKGKKSRTISVRKTDATQINLKKGPLSKSEIKGRKPVSLKTLPETSIHSDVSLLTQTSILPLKPGFSFLFIIEGTATVKDNSEICVSL